MTVADEETVYWELYRVIRDYGESVHLAPFAKQLSMRLFALKPDGVPFQECWNLACSIIEKEDEFIEGYTTAHAYCELVAGVSEYLDGSQRKRAIRILESFDDRIPEDTHQEEYFTLPRDQALEAVGESDGQFVMFRIEDEAQARQMLDRMVEVHPDDFPDPRKSTEHQDDETQGEMDAEKSDSPEEHRKQPSITRRRQEVGTQLQLLRQELATTASQLKRDDDHLRENLQQRIDSVRNWTHFHTVLWVSFGVGSLLMWLYQ